MASYSISVSLVPGAEFSLHADTVDELLTEWEQVKGNRDWLVSTLMEQVPATEAGEGVGALSATLAAGLAGSEVIDSDGQETYEDVPADEPETVQERVDPWSGQKVAEPARRRSPARSEPSRGTSHPASRPASNPGVQVMTDRFDNQWQIGLPEAPNCDHGEPAALVKGISRAGKKYSAYKCAKGAPGGDWRDKCDFHQFPN